MWFEVKTETRRKTNVNKEDLIANNIYDGIKYIREEMCEMEIEPWDKTERKKQIRKWRRSGLLNHSYYK